MFDNIKRNKVNDTKAGFGIYGQSKRHKAMKDMNIKMMYRAMFIMLFSCFAGPALMQKSAKKPLQCFIGSNKSSLIASFF